MEAGNDRHGMVTGLARASGVKRATLSTWFSETKPKVPGLDSLDTVARYLNVSRVELIAAMDAVPLMTEDQAQRIAAQELDRVLVAARREGLLTGEPRTTTGRYPAGPLRARAG